MPAMPDVTRLQIIAAINFIVGQAVAVGWLDANQQSRLVQILSAVVSAAMIIGDAWLRGNRAKAHATVVAAGATTGEDFPVTTPTAPDEGDAQSAPA